MRRLRLTTFSYWIVALFVAVTVAGCERGPSGEKTDAGKGSPTTADAGDDTGSSKTAPSDETADDKATGTTKVGVDDPATGDPVPSDTEVALEVRTVDRAAFDEVVRSHLGKVVLVDFWFTLWTECKKRFPHAVQLSRENKDLHLVTVSIDDADQMNDVKDFLAEQKAGGDNLISKFGLDTKSEEEFNIVGGLPLYKLYDRKGELRYQFSLFPDDLERGQHMDQLDARVAELLAEG